MSPGKSEIRRKTRVTISECNRILLERLSCALQMGPLCTEETLLELTDLGISREEAMAAVLLSAMGLDEETEPGKEIYRGYLPQMLAECAPEDVEEDAYVRAVGSLSFCQGRHALTMDSLEPMQLFVRNDFEMDRAGRVLPQIGFFSREVRFPVLLENGLSWMSCEPNEIATLRPLAQQAYGNVVMMGLGLGYYAYHALLNPEVRSVTVVERDAETIALFQKALLPCFPRHEALTIIQDDAFSFARSELKKRKADTVLVDLWKSAGDGLELYTEMKKIEPEGANWQYWIEKTMQYYLKERERW